MTIPSEDYLFAESAAPGDVSDPSGVRAGGYPFEAPVPYEEFNYLFRALGRWIDNLKGGSGVYASIEEFVDNADVGDTGIINMVDPTGRGDQVARYPFAPFDSTSDNLADVTSDGQYWYCASSTAFTARAQDDIDNVVRTYTEAGTPTTRKKIVSNGTYVAFIYDSTVECRTVDDVAQWTYSAGGPINDVAIKGGTVYIACDTTATAEAQAISIATGSASGLQHGADLHSVTTGYGQAFWGGGASPGGGNTSAGTTVFSTDTGFTSIIWESDAPDAISNTGALSVSLKGEVYCAGTTNSQILRHSDGSIIGFTVIPGGPGASRIEALGKWVYLLVPNVGLVCQTQDEFTGEAAFNYSISDSTADFMAVDGDLILLSDGANGDLYAGPDFGRPVRWRRADPANEAFIPHPRLCYPLE